jgi:DNA-binding response OmpR family regulator
LQIDDIVIDPSAHTVARHGVPVVLTRKEFQLLETLMRSSGRVVTRDRLIRSVWGNEREIESNTLDVFVRQLRAKLESASSRKVIQTVRGVGYVIREEEIS